MDFVSTLGQQEQATDDQDDIAARDGLVEQAKQRMSQTHDPGQR